MKVIQTEYVGYVTEQENIRILQDSRSVKCVEMVKNRTEQERIVHRVKQGNIRIAVVWEVCVKYVLLENIHRQEVRLLVVCVMGQDSIKTKQDERVVNHVQRVKNQTRRKRVVIHVQQGNTVRRVWSA
jgi:hypothetical protein